MKRLVVMLGVLFALAGVIAFTLRRVGGVGERFPASRAAELAPAETIAFLQLPDLERTFARWEKSELQAIANEPEWLAQAWQQFMADTLRKAGEDADTGPLLRALAAVRRMQPAGLFVAITSESAESGLAPKLVCGLPCQAKRTEVDAAVRALKDEIFKALPGATSELSSHGGIEIESITSTISHGPLVGLANIPIIKDLFAARKRQPLAHLAFRDDWLFVATDLALLAETLDRYQRKPEAKATLAAQPDFSECGAHALPEPDLMAWAACTPEGRQLSEHWLPLPLAPEKGETGGPRAVHFSARLDGEVRERLFYLTGQPPPALQPVVRRSLALTTPTDLGYLAVNLAALHGNEGWLREVLPGTQFGYQYAAILTPRKRVLEKSWDAFEPELEVAFPQAGVWPNFVAQLRVKDAAGARLAAESLAGPPALKEGDAWRWNWWNPTRADNSTTVLTSEALIHTSRREPARNRPTRGGASGATLMANPDFAHAMGGAAPNGAFFYFDAPAIFQRSLVAGWTTGPYSVTTGERVPTYFERLENSLPPAAVARRIRPGTVRVQTEGNGWVAESTLDFLGLRLLQRWLKNAK